MEKIKITERTRNTPEIRLQIYKAMFEYLNDKLKCGEYYPYGFCIIFAESIENHGIDYNSNFTSMSRILHELIKYRPHTLMNGYWFSCNYDGSHHRLHILKQVISGLEHKLAEETRMSKLKRKLRIKKDI